MQEFRRKFSAALRCGLIEAFHPSARAVSATAFSAALRCGLIEALGALVFSRDTELVFRSITLRPH